MPVLDLLPAAPEDADAVRSLVRAAYAPYVERIGLEPAPMNADYRQAILDGAVDVVREDGEIVAVVVTRDRGDHLLLENIAVAPSRQGGGFGAQILDWAETRTRALGHDEVRLYTHEKMVENVAFYLRHGFEITGIADEDEFRRIHFRKVCRRDTDQIRRAP